MKPSRTARTALVFLALALAGSIETARGRQVPALKVVATSSAARASLESTGALLIADYGGFAVYAAPPVALAKPIAGVFARDDFNILRFRRGDVDTRLAKAASPTRPGLDLYVVQFAAPPLDAWREAIASDGAEPLAPVPNCALVVRATDETARRLADRPFVQWVSRFGAAERLDPDLDTTLAAGGVASATVQIVDDAEGRALAATLERTALERIAPSGKVAGLLAVRGRWDAATLRSLLDDPLVLNVEAFRALEPQDERAGVISAGQLDAAGAKPLEPGYLDWLLSKGFTGETFDFGIDFLDSGLDWGVREEERMHPDLRDAAGTSRISYASVYVLQNQPADQTGHGTINASIAAGYNAGTSAPQQDESGYRYGLGIAPWARLGSSKILDDGGRPFSLTATFTDICRLAYGRGMRVGNMSVGGPGNRYTVESAEFDQIVRDADPTTAGNQEYTAVCAAGNAYGGYLRGTIITPGTAKNVITVGATENYRPAGVVDGCDVGDDGADDASDIIDFSSGGPTEDGRIKPDIVAPGTHVTGAASQYQVFTAAALCVADGKYYPEGQDLYAWASGTSQATPVVAGGAALVRAYTVLKGWLGGLAPSPAMVKAVLLGAAEPISGEHAGPTLPDKRQGYGRMSLGPVFDDAARVLVDQTVVFGATGASHEIRGEVGDPARSFRVALVWTDAPGSPAFAPQVNDLDLEVRIGDVVYRGNRFDGFVSAANPAAGPDTLNTVEAVTVPAGVRGEFTVTVRASAIVGDGVPGNGDPIDQDFALVIYNVNDGRWPYEEPPVVTSLEPRGRGASFKLLVGGERVTAETVIEINGARVPADRVRWLAGKQRLKVLGPAKTLGVVKGQNRLVAVNGELRSPEYGFEY